LEKVKKHLIDYSIISLGSFILALGISLFLVPCKISTGGVSGVGTVLYHLFEVPLSVTTLIINLLLFACGFKTLPRSSIIKTLYGIVFFSLSLELTDFIASLLSGMVEQIVSDVWIAAIFGGVLVGVGVGLVVLKEASTGGSDFAALILHKLMPHVSVAVFIMIIDTVIILVSAFALSDFSITFYSVVSLYISNKVTDFILISGDTARSVYIISERNEEIANIIMERLERGVTAIHGTGCYSKEEKDMLMCIVRNKEVPRIISIVKEIDRGAFTIVSEVKEVRGLGFKEDYKFNENNKAKEGEQK